MLCYYSGNNCYNLKNEAIIFWSFNHAFYLNKSNGQFNPVQLGACEINNFANLFSIASNLAINKLLFKKKSTN